MIDLSQHGAGNFLDQPVGKLDTELNPGLFDDVVDGDTCQAGIDKGLGLVAVQIVTGHIGGAGDHAHLYVDDAANVGGDGDWHGQQAAETGDHTGGGAFGDLISQHCLAGQLF